MYVCSLFCHRPVPCTQRYGMYTEYTETAEAEVECHLRLKHKGRTSIEKKNMKNINVNISKRTLVTHIGRIG